MERTPISTALGVRWCGELGYHGGAAPSAETAAAGANRNYAQGLPRRAGGATLAAMRVATFGMRIGLP